MAAIKCKYCNMYFKDVDQYITHLETNHTDMIPHDMSGYRFYYFLKTGKDKGSCVICHNPTDWNDKTHKYKRFCNNPTCKEKYSAEFKNRMIGKYGKVTLLNDPDHQKKMLANRKISGIYHWSTGGNREIPYTGTYELSFLEFLDQIMDFDFSDIMAPSPHTYYYMYEGNKHFYIPDFFIPSLNLEIEIKDGDINDPTSNHHPKIIEVDRVKEALKDDVMRSNSNNFNYLKILGKNNKRFFEYLEIAKQQFSNNIDKPIIMI